MKKSNYEDLVQECEYINDCMKYEGSNERAIVIFDKNRYKIVILRKVEHGN